MKDPQQESVATADVICGATEASCICVDAPHADDAPHVCSCGGSWRVQGDAFEILAMPGAGLS